MNIPDNVLPTLLGVALLTGIGALALVFAGFRNWWSPALAIARGTVQLALLSIILTGVITSPYWVAVALLVMFFVAALTSARRVAWSGRRFAVIALGMFTGVALSVTIIFVTSTVEFAPRYLLALGGILIGNSMTAATLTARHVYQRIEEHWPEVEGWFALGATPRQATSEFARRAIHEALVPSTDQTKTTGLVTLPGAFIGAIFGGLDPLEAGRFQVVVLAGILASSAITAVIVSWILSPVTTQPTDAIGSELRRQNAK